jgi:hypothetical protein
MDDSEGVLSRFRLEEGVIGQDEGDDSMAVDGEEKEGASEATTKHRPLVPTYTRLLPHNDDAMMFFGYGPPPSLVWPDTVSAGRVLRGR